MTKVTAFDHHSNEEFLEELRARLNEIIEGQYEMQADITTLKQDVSELKHNVSELKHDVLELKNDMSFVKGSIVAFSDGFEDHEFRLKKLEQPSS
jgi:chromosome segregation ATPase